MDSVPPLHQVKGRAKPVLCGPNNTESNLFHNPHTGLDECPRILLSCFRANNSDQNHRRMRQSAPPEEFCKHLFASLAFLLPFANLRTRPLPFPPARLIDGLHDKQDAGHSVQSSIVIQSIQSLYSIDDRMHFAYFQ